MITIDFFNIIEPNWPKIPNVKAMTVLGISKTGDFVSFAGEFENVYRDKLKIETNINPVKPIHWLKQVHDNKIIELPYASENEADGAFTNEPGVVCAVRTADCLPIVFANLKGTRVGVAHAGWRGLEKNIISSMLQKFSDCINDTFVWIGPGIAQENYEVGPEVREAFIRTDLKFDTAFKKGNGDRFFADVYEIAKIQLLRLGIKPENISGAEWDTFSNNELHSSRRDGKHSGRMATLVWIQP